jgi:hypothetical protein
MGTVQPSAADFATALGLPGGPMDGGYTQVSNIDLPAGYTYFAQFVFHDLTFGNTSRLALASLYGGGPTQSPEFYQSDQPWLLVEGRPVGNHGVSDLPRLRGGQAYIPDARNDRNVMIGQIHAAFIRFHNRVARSEPRSNTSAAKYLAARAQTIHRYRGLVTGDLLPRLTSTETVPAVPIFTARRDTAICAEIDRAFRLAVGQFGHAMVKPRYRLNDVREAVLFRPMTSTAPYEDLRGQPLSETGVINWAHFFPIGDPNVLQRAARINSSVCAPLFAAPTREGTCSIPYLTLISAQRAGLSGGRSLAGRLGITPLPPEMIWADMDIFGDDAPLWFYVLREADVREHGRRLGPLGSRVLISFVDRAMTVGASGEHDYCELSTSSASTVGDFLADA